MHLACPECGAPVEVTPSFANCPACDANVASYYTPAEMTRTIYHRALEHYSMGNEVAALEGIDQGISLLEAPELHLLAALIYRKRGEFKEMREHVAAIPADDILRSEGEWLLRSHQEQLQLGRREEARRRGRAKGTQLAVGKASRQFSTEYYPAPLDKKQVATKGAAKTRRNRLPWAIPIAALLLVIIFLSRGTGDSLMTALQQLRTIPDEFKAVYSSFTRDEPAAVTGADEEPATDSQFSAAAVDTSAPETSPTAAPTPTTLPTPQPTQSQPVQSQPAPTATGSASPQAVATKIAETRLQSFDLTTFLNEQDRSDLAALAIQATWAQGAPPGEMVLLGTVTMASVQTELLALAAEIEGVTSIDGSGLEVVLPETYTVRAGENLRHIALRLYGDQDRWTEIYEANRDLVGDDPNNLWVGLSLTIPHEVDSREEQIQQ
ncbi:MAG: LysM peptidoglycan-binding domain-containing protein [Caldilineaceae bacterium SB0661_bin_32]|uniref:LysM peptidoglycan-binding domain-containing protein n=1 Tax=Caldilineaceae bacterium SB0661_bin_32 TaxID=2605255 RepID=A0A6B1D2I8_9CHLR|nr:LysM peptidoglycan-binding domain-containing protein [Caldilineaceae bacterium SB0661_bin_32]